MDGPPATDLAERHTTRAAAAVVGLAIVGGLVIGVAIVTAGARVPGPTGTASGFPSAETSPSPTNAPTPTIAPTRTSAPTPSQVPTDAHALGGTSIDRVLAWVAARGLTCQQGLAPQEVDPPEGLLGAECRTDPAAPGTAALVTIGYWSDHGVRWIGVSSCCAVDERDREDWLRWVAGADYDGADASSVTAWLFANRPEDCAQGCSFTVGGATWIHDVGDGQDEVGVRATQ